MPTFPTAEAVLKAALSQEGVTEKPANSNHTPYGVWYGVDQQPWCGIFIAWCYAKAGTDLRTNGIQHPLFTPWFWNEAKAAGWVVHSDDRIERGDVLFFDFAPPFNTAGIQHTGFALAASEGGRVRTLEGNTSSGNAGSQDNGGGVYRRARSLDVIVAAVRPPYATKPTEDDMPLTDADFARLRKEVVDELFTRPVSTHWAGATTLLAMVSRGAAASEATAKALDGLAGQLAASLAPQLVTAMKGAGGALSDADLTRIVNAVVPGVATELATRLAR